MMKPFRHVDATSVSEAIRLKSDYGEKAVLLAGGTDILGLLKTRAQVVYPDLVINIKSIPGLDAIETNADGTNLGALTRLSDVAASPEIRRTYPILAQATESVGMPQIRYMGTLGGNLAQETRCWYYRYPHEIGGRMICRRKDDGPCLAVTGDNRYHALFGGKHCFAVCPSDMAIALAALDAQIRITGPTGDRLVKVTDFYHPLGTALAQGEMITQIHIPHPPARNRQLFNKHRIRESIDFAVVSVGLMVAVSDAKTCSFARILFGAVAPGPYRALEAEALLLGKRFQDEVVEAAADVAMAGAVPLSNNAYKIEIAKTLVKRGLQRCLQA